MQRKKVGRVKLPDVNLFFDSLENTGHVFYRLFVHQDVSNVFSWLYGIMSFGEEAHRSSIFITWYQSYLLSTLHVNLDYLAKVELVSFCHYKPTLSPHPQTLLFGKKSLCTTHGSGVGRYAPLPWGWTNYSDDSEICMGDLSLPSCFPAICFIYFPSSLFISIWTHGYLYFESDINFFL